MSIILDSWTSQNDGRSGFTLKAEARVIFDDEEIEKMDYADVKIRALQELRDQLLAEIELWDGTTVTNSYEGGRFG